MENNNIIEYGRRGTSSKLIKSCNFENNIQMTENFTLLKTTFK
jgi:hypothetical protein